MALDPPADVHDHLDQAAVLPAVRHGVHQAGKVTLPLHGAVAFLQDLGEGFLQQDLGLVLVAHPEIIVQIQTVTLLPEETGAEGVDGGNIRLVNQGSLTTQAGVLGMEGKPVGDLGGNAAFELGGCRLGVGDDQEGVDVAALLHPAQQTLH